MTATGRATSSGTATPARCRSGTTGRWPACTVSLTASTRAGTSSDGWTDHGATLDPGLRGALTGVAEGPEARPAAEPDNPSHARYLAKNIRFFRAFPRCSIDFGRFRPMFRVDAALIEKR